MRGPPIDVPRGVCLKSRRATPRKAPTTTSRSDPSPRNQNLGPNLRTTTSRPRDAVGSSGFAPGGNRGRPPRLRRCNARELMPTAVDREEVRRLVTAGAQLVEMLPAAEFEEEHLAVCDQHPAQGTRPRDDPAARTRAAGDRLLP